KSLTGTGVRLIATSPTATTGLPCGPMSPAISWATPSAAAAASSPQPAPASARLAAEPLIVLITGPIRGQEGGGLPSTPFLAKLACRPIRLRLGSEERDMDGGDMRAVKLGTGPEPGQDQDLDWLLGRVARGDQDAFEAVYDRLAGPVYGLIRKVVRDPAQS